MKPNNYFQAALKIAADLNEYEKKQLALILIGQTLTKISEAQAYELSKLQRYK